MTTSLTAPICFEVSSQASLLCVWVVSQGLLPNNSCVCVLVQADKESLFEYIAYIYTVLLESLWTPYRICENVSNFNKTNNMHFVWSLLLFSTVLSKTFK